MKDTTRLEKLLNKEFIYKQENIRVKDYVRNPDNKTIDIITDKKPISIKENEIIKFCEALLPVDEPATQAISTEVVQQTTGLMNTLQQTLLENIAMVKKDPNYIKQANVVNSSVNALIGMAKLQIQVGKMKSK